MSIEAQPQRLQSHIFFLALLRRLRLSAPHPNYHTLLAASDADPSWLDSWKLGAHTISFCSIGRICTIRYCRLNTFLKLGPKLLTASQVHVPLDQTDKRLMIPIHQNVRLLMQRPLICGCTCTGYISDGDFGMSRDSHGPACHDFSWRWEQ